MGMMGVCFKIKSLTVAFYMAPGISKLPAYVILIADGLLKIEF